MPETIKDKIISSSPRFDVIDRNGHIGIIPKSDSVIILPYISDDSGHPLSIGVLKERNLFREGGFSTTLISGRCEDEDPNFLETAKRELKEESGFSVPDNSKWFFLGTVTASKMVDTEHPCFAVDVTDIKKGEATTDDSENEKQSEFLFISSNDVVKVKDVFVPALFLKLFKYVVGMDMYNRDDSVFGKPKGFTAEI
jgi:8-oxo-dGTP pyrophosphatase MutT (NUDIX family)